MSEAERIVLPSDAESVLWNLRESGFLAAREEDGGIACYELAYQFGLMLYGPQRLEPSEDIAWATEGQAGAVLTPFPVEYAFRDGSRGGAPALVRVPDDCGAPVPADVFRVRPDMDELVAEHVLDSSAASEFADKGEAAVWTASEHTAAPEAALGTNYVLDFAGFQKVFYVTGEPNLDFVLKPEMSVEEKADRLAQLAAQSITPETFAERRDGIWYLHQAIASGAQTPLTDAYRQAILRFAGGARDLLEARARIAAARFASPPGPADS